MGVVGGGPGEVHFFTNIRILKISRPSDPSPCLVRVLLIDTYSLLILVGSNDTRSDQSIKSDIGKPIEKSSLCHLHTSIAWHSSYH